MPASPLALIAMLTGRLLPSLTSEIIDLRLRRMSGALTPSNYVSVVPRKQHTTPVVSHLQQDVGKWLKFTYRGLVIFR